MNRRDSKTSARRVKGVMRRRKATELRVAGASYRKIAEVIKQDAEFGSPGYTERDAYEDIKVALKEAREAIQENAQEIVELELQRLDVATLAIFSQVKSGNHGAIDRMLRIMERRAKFLNLDNAKESSIEPTVIFNFGEPVGDDDL